MKQEHAIDYEFARSCITQNRIDDFIHKYGSYIERVVSDLLVKKRLIDHRENSMNDIFNDIITYLFSEKKLLKYNGYSKLSTWLYTIIRGHLIEFVKLEVYGRKIKIKQNEKSNYVFQGEFKKLGYINHKEIIHECEGINKKEKEAEAYEENIYKLKLLLNRCSERQVAVLKLYYCKDMHYREIGKTLNISKTAVGNEMKWIKALIEEYKVMTVCELS